MCLSFSSEIHHIKSISSGIFIIKHPVNTHSEYIGICSQTKVMCEPPRFGNLLGNQPLALVNYVSSIGWLAWFLRESKSENILKFLRERWTVLISAKKARKDQSNDVSWGKTTKPTGYMACLIRDDLCRARFPSALQIPRVSLASGEWPYFIVCDMYISFITIL